MPEPGKNFADEWQDVFEGGKSLDHKNLLKLILRMQDMPRLYQARAGLPIPQSIAEHSFNTAMISLLFMTYLRQHGILTFGTESLMMLARNTVFLASALHDMSESVLGDILRDAKTPDLRERDAKYHKVLVDALLSGVGIGETNITPEFVESMVEICDNIELMLGIKLSCAGDEYFAKVYDRLWDYLMEKYKDYDVFHFMLSLGMPVPGAVMLRV